jgi:cytosine/adenosine deaminase-related metal-dependent hydrolase
MGRVPQIERRSRNDEQTGALVTSDAAPVPSTVVHDIVIRGGRIIDPESGLDAIGQIGIIGSTIRAVTTDEELAGHRVLDADGMIVAPGWIDLHSHAQSVAGSRLQVLDGVTTALDLEGGLTGVAAHLEDAAREGRATNYGSSASWQQARMIEVGGLEGDRPRDVLTSLGGAEWKRAASRRQTDALLDRLGADIADGAIGVGLLLGYAPATEPEEYLRVSQLAADTGTGTFTHARDLVETVPDVAMDGAEEIVRAADLTGARAHYCHVNSTSLWHVDRVHRLIERSPAPVTTEAYPYGAGSTAIGAAFLAPERLAERRLTPSSIVYTPTGQRVRDVDELVRLRRDDPGAIVIIHLLDEDVPRDRLVLDQALTFPGTVVASDAMPLVWDAEAIDPLAWPPPRSVVAHPRGAGTYSRFLRQYVRTSGRLSWTEAVTRCSLGPARILESFVPVMRRKGRLQVGCDADIVVLDPSRVTDRATYDVGTLPSAGYAFVIVAGQVTVTDDRLDPAVLAGVAVTSSGRGA